jgi:hypothetical protein
MQSLLSRVGQAHRCGCRTCSTAVRGFGRRATAAPRRRATFADIFTACYSSVFASAAVIDAVRKDERRREIDQQLEETRRELAELRAQPDPAALELESTVSPLSDEQMQLIWRELKSIYLNRPYMKEISEPAELPESDMRQKLQQEQYNILDKDSMRKRRETDLDRMDMALMIEETLRSLPRRDMFKRSHMERYCNDMVYLMLQMMQRAESRPEDASVPSRSFDDALKLLDEGYPRYTFRDVNPEQARQSLIQLNRASRSVINDTKLGRKEVIGRICYNMAISSFPPDIHVFNALIVAFDRHAHYRRFSEALVYSFFYEGFMMPTPSTFAAILHHFKVTGNHGRFLRAVACIAGVDDTTGAKVRSHHSARVQRTGTWDTKKQTLTGDYVWDHAHINRLVVEELLSGFMSFHMLDAAVSLFASCMRIGVSVTAKLTKQILDECIYRLDWAATLRLVQELTSNRAMWDQMLKAHNNRTVAYIIDRLYSLLDLIGLRPSGEIMSKQGLDNLGIAEAEFGTLLENISATNRALPKSLFVSSRRKHGLDPSSVIPRNRLLQLESLSVECDRVRKTTRSIESKLLYPVSTAEFRLSMAMHIGNAAIEASSRLSDEYERLLVPESEPQALRGEEPNTWLGMGVPFSEPTWKGATVSYSQVLSRGKARPTSHIDRRCLGLFEHGRRMPIERVPSSVAFTQN